MVDNQLEDGPPAGSGVEFVSANVKGRPLRSGSIGDVVRGSAYAGAVVDCGAG